MSAKFKVYGDKKIKVVVVHGGPGAPGSAQPIAEQLGKSHGVLEPFQTKTTIDGQIEELKQMIQRKSETPVYLIGWSWGAWLAYLTTANYPALVKKMVLVSSGPFEAKFATKIMETRLNRLSEDESKKVQEIMSNLQKGKTSPKLFMEFGKLMNKADTFQSIANIQKEDFPFEPKVYNGVWTQAAKLRETGELLEIGKLIKCPVVAIHGDYDPHPSEGVEKPLVEILRDFKFILLKNCGHEPWNEKEAKDEFFKTLEKELS